MLTARDIMTKEVSTIGPQATVAELAQMLEAKRINGVPVVDPEGRLVGVVTQNDLIEQARGLELPPVITLLDAHLFLERPSHFLKRLEKIMGSTVGEVMTPNPTTIFPETPVSDIASLMARKKVHTLPVVEEGKLLGVIGKIDVIRALAPESTD